MGLIDCSELARRKTRGSEGLNTYWSCTLFIMKVTAALGGLATKSFLPIIIPDARGNFLPGSWNGCEQPPLLQFRWIPAHSLSTEGQEAVESFPHLAGEKKFSLCRGRLDWKATPGKAYSAPQPVAAQKPRGRFVLAQPQGAQRTLGPGLVGFVVLDGECSGVFSSWGGEWRNSALSLEKLRRLIQRGSRVWS